MTDWDWTDWLLVVVVLLAMGALIYVYAVTGDA